MTVPPVGRSRRTARVSGAAGCARARALFAAAALSVLLLPGPALSAPAPAADLTGDQVKSALRRGTRFLLNQQTRERMWLEQGYPGGTTCLATLALLQAGIDPDSAELAGALDGVRRAPDVHTYVVSLKIMALAAADPRAYRQEIERSVKWLINAQSEMGLWDYMEARGRFDHSNTQFALLGLHAAAEADVKIPPTVWRRAQAALLRNQNHDGGWAYQAGGNSYGSMTAAGVAGLIILGTTFEQGQERGFTDGAAPGCGQYRTTRPLARGMEWLSRQFDAGRNPGKGEFLFYWLYTVERCGILSGQRFFGPHDWYRSGASVLVRTQAPNGSWNSDLVDTSFAVLFLAKGHKSLAIQKLQWSADDAWTPDRYDVDHLIARLGTQLGQPATWQVVPFDAPLEEWLAAPLLYFHGHTFPKWDAAQRAKLRAYVQQGGTLFAEACCGKAEFRAGFEEFARTTFREAPLHKLGAEHAVYRVLHEVPSTGLMGIDLGCRTSVLYSPNDLSCLWEQPGLPESAAALQLGANIIAYAVGRRPLRDRLDVVVLPKAVPLTTADAGPPPQDAFRLAQVVYEGDWRPFPQAAPNLAQVLRSELGLDVITQELQIRLTDPQLHVAPVLWLAGHFEFELSLAEREALAAHLDRGGFLIADACCGTEPFDTSLRRLLRQMFPDAELERLPADHPIFAGKPGFDVRQARYTPDVLRVHPERNAPELWGLRLEGRLVVVYSPYSLSCGLAGPAFDGCWGYVSEDARRLAANIVLWALTH